MITKHNTWQDDGVHSYPTILTEHNIPSLLMPLTGIHQIMVRSNYSNIRSYHCAMPDSYLSQKALQINPRHLKTLNVVWMEVNT